MTSVGTGTDPRPWLASEAHHFPGDSFQEIARDTAVEKRKDVVRQAHLQSYEVMGVVILAILKHSMNVGHW